MAANDNPAGEFLVVEVAGQRFGIDTASVETVVAPAAVTPLPFVPSFVEGLVSVNERIVPQLDLYRLLGEGAMPALTELVVVETARSPCALRVGRILGKAEVAADELQPVSGESEAVMLRARFAWEGQSVLVLDVDMLGGLVNAQALPEGERGLLGRLQADTADADAAALDCVVLVVGRERYAMALTDAVEILDLPAATPVPGAPALMEGLAMVRDDVLPVLSLAALLRVPAAADSRRNVVVLQREGRRYGLRVDGLDGIRQLREEQLRRIDDNGCDVSGVLASADGLLGLLTPARLLDDTRLRALQPFLPAARAQSQQKRERLHTLLQVALGEEEFGIPLEAVRRIADYSAPEIVQGEDDSLVSGAVSLEGRVLPVADLAARLRAGDGNDGAWVLLGEGEQEWAVPVRAALGIITVPESALEEIAAERGGFVTAIARVEQRLLSLLSIAPLLATADRRPASA